MNRSMGAAALILMGLSAWMLSGVFFSDTAADEAVAPQSAKDPTKVQVLRSRAVPVQRLVRVQGQVEANRVLQLKAEVEGQVQQLPLAEGEAVTAGTLLVQLAEDYRPAQLAEAQARLKQRESDLAASKKLRERGLGAENALIAAQAEVRAAEAALAQAEYQLEHTRISAPFAGVLNSLAVEVGDFVEKGQVVAELVDNHSLIVSGQVPQHSVAGLHIGQDVMVKVATGRDSDAPLPGHLKFISATAEQSTRSYYAEVSLPNPDQRRLIGLSATLLLPVGQLRGHWVPSSALGLASDGGLQVKVVADNTVSVMPVEMIRTERAGFWIAGLPDEAAVITVGQDFVSAGERVEPVAVDENGTGNDEAASPALSLALSAAQ